jgi:hypothetical protein
MASTAGDGLTFSYVYSGNVLAIGSALPAVCILIVSLRVWTRMRQRAKIGLDDWLIIASLVSSRTSRKGEMALIPDPPTAVHRWNGGMLHHWCDALLLRQSSGLTPRHQGAELGVMGYPTPPPPANITGDLVYTYVEPAVEITQQVRRRPSGGHLSGLEPDRSPQIEFAFQLLMIAAYGCIKLSIVYFYRRLFVAGPRTVFAIVTNVTVGVIILWTIAMFLVFLFDCGANIWANWTSLAAAEAYCSIGFTSEEAMAISDLILDFWVMLLPFPMVCPSAQAVRFVSPADGCQIWGLHLTVAKKLALTGIFLLGAMRVHPQVASGPLVLTTLQGDRSLDHQAGDIRSDRKCQQ